ncbi:MAG TPA: hypothetical protein PKD64_10195 [Pirellulaceae bacterium]|nr:hypothetical protein [Pirellulaceae bacterium]HMO92551.1 hypothetical protein [Pirellulaceae bacterium]HMP68967.1 hypothetical protein [Pirellulaceae bacterium]
MAFKVSESWVRRIKQDRRELGKTAPQQTRHRQAKRLVYQHQIIEIIRTQPDITLSELQNTPGTSLSRSTLCVALSHLKLTFEKKY